MNALANIKRPRTREDFYNIAFAAAGAEGVLTGLILTGNVPKHMLPLVEQTIADLHEALNAHKDAA